eukprot:gene10162-2582_t
MDANEIYNEGVKLFKEKKNQEAYDLFSKAIAKKSTVFNYFHARGLCAKNLDKVEQAISDFEKAMELKPGYTKSLAIVVKLYQKTGATNKALDAYTQLIQTAPSHFHYFDRGTLLSEIKGKEEEAISDFTKAIALDETMAIAYYNRALLYYAEKEYDKALRDFNKTLEYEMDPDANTYIDRGLCYYYTDKDTEAMKDFKKAVEIEPDNKRAKNLLEQLQ